MKLIAIPFLLFGLLVGNISLASDPAFDAQLLSKTNDLKKLLSDLMSMDLENSAGPVAAVFFTKRAVDSLSYRYGDSSGLVAKFCYAGDKSTLKIENSSQCEETSSKYFRVFDSIKGIERRNILADYDRVLSAETYKQVFTTLHLPYDFSRSYLMHLSVSVNSYNVARSEGFVSSYSLKWKVVEQKSMFKQVKYSCSAFVYLQTDKGVKTTDIGYSSCMNDDF